MTSTLSITNRAYLFSKDPLAHLERYEGLVGSAIGWVLSLFDRTLCVHDEQRHQYFYVRTQDVVQALCAIPDAPLRLSVDSSSGKIQQLVLAHLNPLIGEAAITTEKVRRFFTEFRSSEFLQQLQSAENSDKTNALAIQRLKALKTKSTTVLTFKDWELEQRLKPGDIIFKKSPVGLNKLVIKGQKLTAPFIRGKRQRQAYEYNHVAMYIGNGKIAEANYTNLGTPVRILDIRHKEFALDSSSPTEYLVTRCRDQELAGEAADVAAQIAKDDIEEPEKRGLKYDLCMALRSIFTSSSFGPSARYRFLEQYNDDRQGVQPKTRFFCSYFVGYCYQTAESRRIMPEILRSGDEPSEGCNQFCTTIRRAYWMCKRRFQLWRQMGQRIQFQFDPKHTSPHNLRNFVARRPNLFRDLYIVQKPLSL